VRRCAKDKCKGAIFRPKLAWSDVEKSFFGRWDSFHKRREENLKKLDKATLPPFRLLKHTSYVPGEGFIEEDIPVSSWADVAEEFFERNNEAIERINARVAEAAAASAKEAEKFTLKINTDFKFSKPLPDF
jgi:hypothetical protein